MDKQGPLETNRWDQVPWSSKHPCRPVTPAVCQQSNPNEIREKKREASRMMCFPRRFIPIFLGFFGLLITIGYRSVFSMVMVHILKSDEFSKSKDPYFLGFYCFINGSLDLPADWTVSSAQYLHSAYYTGSFCTQLLGGYLAVRFSPKMVCGIAILMSSILLLVIPYAIKVHFVLVLGIRILQGTFEGCCVPALNGVISAWAPKSEKTRIVTFVFAGVYLSPAVAFVVSGITGCIVSWDVSLYIYGGCGVFWSAMWMLFIYDTPAQHSGLSLKEKLLLEREGPGVQQSSDTTARNIPWRQILTSLPVWATVVACFCRDWVFSMTIMGVPQYFKIAFSTNIAEIGFEVALPAVFMTIVTVTGGVLFDKLIKSNLVSTTVGRKIAQCVGFGVEACCILGLRFIDRREIALIVLCIGVAFSGLAISGYQVNVHDLAPQFTSVLSGLNRLGLLGGAVCSIITGLSVPTSIEAWHHVFTITGAIHAAGVVFYAIFASGERQNWIEDPESKSLIKHAEQNTDEMIYKPHGNKSVNYEVI